MRIIAPLLFSYAGDTDRETLAKAGVAPEDQFPAAQSLPGSCADRGQIDRLRPPRLCPLVLRQRGHKRRGVAPLSHLAGSPDQPDVSLRAGAGRHAAANYYYLYFGEIDGHGHTYGPESRQLAAEAECLLMLNGALPGRLPPPLAPHR